MRRRQWVAAATALAPLLLGAAPAWADAPSRTGWWNVISAGGMALPLPTTAADDLHVSQGPSGPAAFSAVAYDLFGQAVSGATLQLKITPNSTVGTVAVLACPTKDASWKAGGNQPYDAAPEYDCVNGEPGMVAADGSGITFFLDAPTGATGYSLAIVPAADATAFSVDIIKPDAASLVVQLAEAAVEPGPVAAPVAAPPATTTGAGSAPLGTGTAPLAPTAALQAPAVAVPAVPAPQAAPAPAALAAASSRPIEPVSNRERYIAGSMLALLSGLIVWLAQQPSPQPRLLGGMARKAGPVAVPVVDPNPRGIGRFATLRTAPARPLV
ncbi:MAG: hypothetical protein JJD92_11435 [Frankiaceae bacterium]|nr:hypothetical protein [Frankiaceae bacterium]